MYHIIQIIQIIKQYVQSMASEFEYFQSSILLLC